MSFFHRFLLLALASVCCSGLLAQSSASSSNWSDEAIRAGLDLHSPVVLLFHSVSCPISDRYVPEIKRLQDKYESAAKIRFVLVFPNQDESDEAVADYIGKRELKLAVLRDRDSALTRRMGARVTPEAVVLLPGTSGPELVYRGRYDDRYSELGRPRPRASVRFLDDVLASVVSGDDIKFMDTKAVGCYLVSEQMTLEAGDSQAAVRKRDAVEEHRH